MSDVSFRLMEEIVTKEDKGFYEELGTRVAKLRKENHITQVQLAEALGVSQQQIASFEVGRVKIPTSMLPKLSSLFSTSPAEILGMESHSKRGPASKLQRQVEHISQLPRSKQDKIIVKELKITPEPEAEVANKPGLKIWKLNIAGKKEKTVTLGYQVKWPSDQRVIGME